MPSVTLANLFANSMHATVKIQSGGTTVLLVITVPNLPNCS